MPVPGHWFPQSAEILGPLDAGSGPDRLLRSGYTSRIWHSITQGAKHKATNHGATPVLLLWYESTGFLFKAAVCVMALRDSHIEIVIRGTSQVPVKLTSPDCMGSS